MSEIKYENSSYKNPAQLLRMFVFFSIISLVVIVVSTGYGILTISRQANIAEAEHDAIGISRAFIGKEGEYLLNRLSEISTDPVSQGGVTLPTAVKLDAKVEPGFDLQQKYYTVQMGSFRREEGAIVAYDKLLAELPSAAVSDLRVENVGDYYAVRFGKSIERAEILVLQEMVAAVTKESILLKVHFLPERVIKPLSTQHEATTVISDSLDSELSMSENVSAHVVFDSTNEKDKEYDARIRKLLKSLDVAKIKIFSLNNIIVYSTDWSIIGKDNSNNKRLADALAGNVNSLLKKKSSMTDIVGEQKIDLDVVETYLPVVSLDGEVIGAFEIYMDITRYRADTKERVVKSVLMILMVLFLVFMVLALIMRSGTKELSSVQEELFKLSAIDGLTGLLTRRFLFERLAEEYARIHISNRKNQIIPSFGCIMIDIDFFKKFNDTYGHQVGDSVLKFVASRIETSLRKYDVAGRYGGEEFLVLLPNSSMADAKMVADRIWGAIRSESYTEGGETYNVTVSVGYSCVTEDDDTFELAIGRADKALYQAKETGRDRVCTVE